jgi:hypothetical protein
VDVKWEHHPAHFWLVLLASAFAAWSALDQPPPGVFARRRLLRWAVG